MKIVKKGSHRLFEEDRETQEIVSSMLIDLEKNGMDAVRKYSKKFDDYDPDDFELNEKQIRQAIESLDDQIIKDTDYCQYNVRQFAQKQFETMLPLEVEIRPGVILGHKHIPVNGSGSYVPGGRYPMFGSAQMTIIPAKVAGVHNVICCTPPVKGKGFYPATINAVHKAGADRIFIIGGVPAFALMAFGMGVVEPVDILCGAGNKYVAEAKRQLFGRCGIDLLAGPTEILIIGDETADPELMACDILGQAEHDPNSGLCLICLDEKTANETIKQVERQLETLPTKEVASQSWRDNGIVYVAESRDEAIKISDEYGPEHLEVHCENLDYYLEKLKNYGSLFLGEETTVAYGDKSIGTNHVLPTSKAARYTGGLWVGKFIKTCTYQKMTKKASRDIALITERQCSQEKMLAHGITARFRYKRYDNRDA
jgi:sulfopropanediol 3-dehydrogenase